MRDRRPASIAHLRFHPLQRLAAADADFHLVFLEAGDDAPAAHLHAGAKPRHIRLQYFIASACWASAFGAAETSAASESAEAIAK